MKWCLKFPICCTTICVLFPVYFFQEGVFPKTFMSEVMERGCISSLKVKNKDMNSDWLGLLCRTVLLIRCIKTFLSVLLQTRYTRCSLRLGLRKCRTLWTDGCRWIEASSSPCTECGSSASTERLQLSHSDPTAKSGEKIRPARPSPELQWKLGAQNEEVLTFFCGRMELRSSIVNSNNCNKGDATSWKMLWRPYSLSAAIMLMDFFFLWLSVPDGAAILPIRMIISHCVPICSIIS